MADSDDSTPGRKAKYSVAAGSSNASGNGSGYNSGMAVFSYIAGGILVWSLIGWGLDVLLGTHWIVLVGAFLGLAGGFYLSFTHRLSSARDNVADGPPKAGDAAPPGER